jgi:peptide/nickel transport system permease protein
MRGGAFLAQRLAALVWVLLGISVVVFLILRLTPGDPALVLLGPIASEEDLARLRHELGLTAPLHVQYAVWLWHVVHGDFGRSITMHRPVLGEALLKLRATALLTGAALVVSSVVGIAAGVLAGWRRNSAADRLSMVLALVGVSVPVFWLGIVLIYVFSVWLRVLPAGGMHSPFGGGALDTLAHLVLPAVTLGAASSGIVARITRSSVLEVIRQDYMRTARAKGLRDGQVLRRHGLKNALIPVITVIGVQMGFLLSGAILTETVFSWPGIGTMLVTAILSRDFPTVQGGVLLVAALFVLVNLATDLSYTLLDPRIRYES